MAFTSIILSVFQSNWPLYLSLCVILLMQLWLLRQLKSSDKKRFRIRLGLNLFVVLMVFLFILRPGFRQNTDTDKILVTNPHIPKSYIRHVMDSLRIKDAFETRDFEKLISKNPNFADKSGNIYLLGQNFSLKTIIQLSNKSLNWIPYFKQGELQDIHWNSVTSKGDMQEISGKLSVDESTTLSIRYGNQVLDSLILHKGFNTFHFSFPVFTIGRTEALLTLAETPLQPVHFFAHKPKTRNVLFILANPDFESKNLSEWLGKNHHKVQIITAIAKGAQSKVSINNSQQTKAFNADIVITDPANANHALVKKAIADGKSVLFINCMNAEQDARTINESLGTNWRLKKTTNEQFVSVADNLTALPYTFEPALNQKSIGTYPVAVQKKSGKVGLSLMNETFQLKLSGDSLGYSRIWSTVFQQLMPPAQDNVIIDSPIFSDTHTPIIINNPTLISNELKIGNDTTILTQSPVNPLTFSADYIFRKSGWQSFQDSLSVYVESNTSSLHETRQMQETLMSHQGSSTFSNNNESAQTYTATLPDWIWYLLILVGLVALWVEPKLNL